MKSKVGSLIFSLIKSKHFQLSFQEIIYLANTKGNYHFVKTAAGPREKD